MRATLQQTTIGDRIRRTNTSSRGSDALRGSIPHVLHETAQTNRCDPLETFRLSLSAQFRRRSAAQSLVEVRYASQRGEETKKRLTSVAGLAAFNLCRTSWLMPGKRS